VTSGGHLLEVQFKSFGPLRIVLGVSSMTVNVPDGASVREVILKVLEIGGPSLEKLVLERGKISGNLIVMLNRVDVSRLDGLDTQVHENDEVTLLPHVQGGRR
jgi:molybdopterin converting factor small subunit